MGPGHGPSHSQVAYITGKLRVKAMGTYSQILRGGKETKNQGYAAALPSKQKLKGVGGLGSQQPSGTDNKMKVRTEEETEGDNGKEK